MVAALYRERMTDRRRKALLFLIHLVGDSTQPFHCDERNGDGGGNNVAVDFQGVGPDGKSRPAHNTNLHAVWDEVLINDHVWSWGTYVEALETETVPTLPTAVYGPGFAEAWVNECHAVARQVYGMTPQDGSATITLDATYQHAVQPILDRLLAMGGLRLAALLNAIFH